ncbi:hypothetical protein TNCT_422451 [Trichonephila clavata]|uniref:Uncharacterized protein n=1 Tax=Trichonephila clavata TaxID=2740835 RepID=A0A8X6KJ84_TRICU|nr:hypothetical protein TNCT_422451 [Trichonephila clavata]
MTVKSTPLPHLFNQSDCLYSHQERTFLHPGPPLQGSSTFQIGEEGSAMIHIPMTLIESEKKRNDLFCTALNKGTRAMRIHCLIKGSRN